MLQLIGHLSIDVQVAQYGLGGAVVEEVEMVEQPFLQALASQRAAFVTALDQPSVLNKLQTDAAFKDVLETAFGYGLKPMDLARATKMSPATISRWASGKSAPHFLVRRAIVAEIQRLLADL